MGLIPDIFSSGGSEDGIHWDLSDPEELRRINEENGHFLDEDDDESDDDLSKVDEMFEDEDYDEEGELKCGADGCLNDEDCTKFLDELEDDPEDD